MKYLITYGFRFREVEFRRTVEINQSPKEWIENANRIGEDYFLLMVFKM